MKIYQPTLVNKKIEINEGDIISFPVKDKIRIIKILVKRNNGMLSEIENKVLLAQVNFQVNFQEKQWLILMLKKG